MNLFSKLLGGGGGDGEAVSRISQHFSKLDKHQGGLSKDIATYVVRDTGSSVLSTLSSPAVHNYWRTGGQIWPREDRFKDVFKSGVAWTDAQLARLGDIQAALMPLANKGWGQIGTGKSPDWLRHVLVIRATREGKICDVSDLVRLAAHRDLGVDVVADIVFGPNPTEYQAENCIKLFGGVDTWLKQDVADITRHADQMAAVPKAQLMAAIGRYDLTGPYLDLLLDGAVSSSKSVKEAARAALTQADSGRLSDRLRTRFAASSPGNRADLAAFAARTLGPAVRPLLDEWLAAEALPKVKTALENALAGLAASAGGEESDSEAGYVALDGSMVPIAPVPAAPGAPPLPDAVINLLRPSMDSFNTMLAKAKREAADEKWHWSKHYTPVGAEVLREIKAATVTERSGREGTQPATFGWMQVNASFDRSGIEAFLSSPAVTLRHLANLLRHGSNANLLWVFSPYGQSAIATEVRRRLEAGADLRMLHDVWREVGGDDAIVMHLSNFWGSSIENIEAGILWPLVARHFDRLEEAMGFRPQSGSKAMNLAPALELLGTLPKVPRRFQAPLMAVATGTRKAPRAEARRLLAAAPGIEDLIARMLEDGKQEVRAGAAEWLAQRGARAHVKAVRVALKSEKSDVVRAAFITALERLGNDVSDVFDPVRMKAEAEAGLAKTQTKGFEWFPLDTLPAVAWRGGGAVDPLLVRWWVVLANKLKQPAGNALMDLWLDRLAPGDAHRLGLYVLSAWIAQDTRTCSLDEANAHAASLVDVTLQQHLQYVKQYPQSAGYWITDRDKLFAQIRNAKFSTYLGSAVDNKGVLGLATRVEGADMARLARAFLKNHGSRVSQCKALLDALAANPSSAAIQVVLAVANRFKAKSVQAYAGELIEEIATRRGWSTDELADRTIPTAGLDETGTADLDCGADRTYRMVLDASDALALLNASGQPVKALPSPRHDEEKPLIEEAKKTLATARKEIKQVLPDQTARLREAMCLERKWSLEDWQLYLLGHPIVARLARRLVWMGLDGEGQCLATFRPLDDNSLSDNADGTVDAGLFTWVQLAHSRLVDAETARAWQAHLADYEVASPFDQFGRDLPVFDAKDKDDKAIDDRRGWMIETFKLRGAATKLGYTRGAAEDGGIFMTYERTYQAAGLVALLHFSGSPLPEENIQAALLELQFAKLRRNSQWHGVAATLGEVPPVLLAETWQDLRDIAAKGTGFDADWEKKTPW